MQTFVEAFVAFREPAGDVQESTRATTTSTAFIFPISFLLNAMPMFSGELTSQFLLLGSVMLIPRELNETVELLLLYPLESLLNEPADFLDSLRTKRRKTIIDRPPQRWSKS